MVQTLAHITVAMTPSVWPNASVLEGVFEKRRFLDLLRHSLFLRMKVVASLPRKWPATINSTPSTSPWRNLARDRCDGAVDARSGALLRHPQAAENRGPARRRRLAHARLG